MSIEIGMTIEGTVVKIIDCGVLVRLPNGDVGLVHISEIADAFVRNARDYFKENDRILVKVLKVDERGRYVLSAKQANASVATPKSPPNEARPPDSRKSEENRPRRSSSVPQNFEARLAKFLKESEERLGDLKRNIESKRGHGRK